MSQKNCVVFRHPRPEGAAGLCVGARSDLPVHWRRSKRLARRIQALARRQRMPKRVCCSPLQRCADTGRWLRRWGWQLHLDANLLELDFGDWDGRPWHAIGRAGLDAWVADFAAFAPGGGESLAALLARAAAWSPPPDCAVAISHGGWMLARRWRAEHCSDDLPRAADWPAPPKYGEPWPVAPPVQGPPAIRPLFLVRRHNDLSQLTEGVSCRTWSLPMR